MANYIDHGIEHAKASVEDILCTLIKEKLQKVCSYVRIYILLLSGYTLVEAKHGGFDCQYAIALVKKINSLLWHCQIPYDTKF